MANDPIIEETFDKSSIADLVAQHGSSSATAWLEFDRYKIWRPTKDIPESSFRPVQGYMRKDPYLYAWGNPLVSDSTALRPTATAFQEWADSQNLRLIWSCVDHELEQVLAEPPFEWSCVSCIYEDVVDPAHVVELTGPEAVGKQGGASVVKDLKKNLKRADKQDVHVTEVTKQQWSDEDKKAVEQGIIDWKKSKSGVQIASTTLQPWLDQGHRRYWLAKKDDTVIGVLILTPIQNHAWQIKNAVSFPNAPKGTSEKLIFTALRDLNCEQQENGTPQSERVTVTFGISAADELHPVKNLSGWKVTAMSKIYGTVTQAAGLLRRSEFRSKFDSGHDPMYVCYPGDGFNLEGVNTLLKLLKK
ncbi:hypothetical protein BDZ94DRAFT_1155912 [Collybia nuda]|uniref:Phosphatidylglycerol lysyltransferase C-terminal domain-containing protein n=1 Tax=Collybia nuda TaxID=64659 RepID=A0A9P6CP68_9AGAR|nr:hypothetical protein BDZ94DRAFT_1155912 [Collybia nuda]